MKYKIISEIPGYKNSKNKLLLNYNFIENDLYLSGIKLNLLFN